MYGDWPTFKPGELIELAPGVLTVPWQPTARRVCLYLRRETSPLPVAVSRLRGVRGWSVVNHVILIDGQERLYDVNIFNSANLL
jgi:hypothetical protein